MLSRSGTVGALSILLTVSAANAEPAGVFQGECETRNGNKTPINLVLREPDKLFGGFPITNLQFKGPSIAFNAKIGTRPTSFIGQVAADGKSLNGWLMDPLTNDEQRKFKATGSIEKTAFAKCSLKRLGA